MANKRKPLQTVLSLSSVALALILSTGASAQVVDEENNQGPRERIAKMQIPMVS